MSEPPAEKPPTRRERQAQVTRAEILRAARRLFAERGYSRTSVRDIAEAAGVSAQTVYDSIGAKQLIVARLNDLIDVEAGVGTLAGQAMGSGDPAAIAGLSGAISRSILEHCGDIILALVTGAAAEPDLAVVMSEGRRRHVDGARQIVERLEGLDALRADLTADDAIEGLSAITDVQYALLLYREYGWSYDRIEEWMAATSRLLLLRPT